MSDMTNIDYILDFITAGKAEFTIKSVISGKTLKYKVAEHSSDPDPFTRFVFRELHGSWDYVGLMKLRADSPIVEFRHTGKSPAEDSQVFSSFDWFIRMLNGGIFLKDKIQFYHNGSCGKCGRTLTNPVSIERGIGPICGGYQ